MTDVKRGNVLMARNSGVGKSALVNKVLGEDGTEAQWSTKGMTEELEPVFNLNNSIGVLKDMPCCYYTTSVIREDNWFVGKH